MEMKRAVTALSAMAQESRLEVFRLLMKAGPEGLPAGEIARLVGIAPNTLTAQLHLLTGAGLAKSRREGRSVIYSADHPAATELIAWLIEDCCQGRPEVCTPLQAAVVIEAQKQEHMPDEPAPDRIEPAAGVDEPFNVLFLCTGNSARSILAEAILARSGMGKFRAYSAGSQPKGDVHPAALKLLERYRYPTGDLRSKSWDEFSGPEAPKIDFVFTVCGNAANEVCPIWPGHPMTAHWGVPDPAAVEGTEEEVDAAFADAFNALSNRIDIFANLPVSEMTPQDLKRQLVEIGQTHD